MEPGPKPHASASASINLPSFELIDTSVNPNEADSLMFADRLTSDSSSSVSKITTCGIKGIESGRDGISDPGEWGWHVSLSFF